MPRCPFYGYHAVKLKREGTASGYVETARPGFLVPQGGNECALITETFSPCRMEMQGLEPELEQCELGGTGRAQEFATYERTERKEANALPSDQTTARPSDSDAAAKNPPDPKDSGTA